MSNNEKPIDIGSDIDVDHFNNLIKDRAIIIECKHVQIWETLASRATSIKEYKRKRKDGLRRFYVNYEEFHPNEGDDGMNCCCVGYSGDINRYDSREGPLTFEELLDKFFIYRASNPDYY